jgi:hypothetical protein
VTTDLLLPIILSIGWLVLAGSALASMRLGWSRLVRLALVWLAIFAGLFLVVEWFSSAQSTAPALL